MIKTMADKLSEKLIGEKVILMEEKEIYSYGLQLLIATILKISGLMILGYLTGNVLEMIIFVISFGILRTFAGGIHANSYLLCFITTVIVAYLSILVSHQFEGSDSIAVLSIILLLANIIVYRFSPIDSPNKPLTDTEKVINRKRSIKTAAIGSIIIIVIHVVNPMLHIFTMMAALGLFIEALTLLQFRQVNLFSKEE